MEGPPPRERGLLDTPLVGDCVEWAPFSADLIAFVNESVQWAWNRLEGRRVRRYLDGTSEDCDGFLTRNLNELRDFFYAELEYIVRPGHPVFDELARACARGTLGAGLDAGSGQCTAESVRLFLDNLLGINQGCDFDFGSDVYTCGRTPRADCICSPTLQYTCRGTLITREAPPFQIVPWFLMPDGYWAFSRVACGVSVDQLVAEASSPLRLTLEQECRLQGACVVPLPLGDLEVASLGAALEEWNWIFWGDYADRRGRPGAPPVELLDSMWLDGWVGYARRVCGSLCSALSDDDLAYLGILTDGPTTDRLVCLAKGLDEGCYTHARGSTPIFTFGTPPVVYTCGRCG
jgi:hypothetical protein